MRMYGAAGLVDSCKAAAKLLCEIYRGLHLIGAQPGPQAARRRRRRTGRAIPPLRAQLKRNGTQPVCVGMALAQGGLGECHRSGVAVHDTDQHDRAPRLTVCEAQHGRRERQDRNR